MKKLYLSIIAVLLVSILIFSGCDLFDDEDVAAVIAAATPAISVGSTLTLTGTITHVFVPDTLQWAANYSSVGNNYVLISEHDDSTLATDIGGNADLNLSYGTPTADMLDNPTDAGYTSSNSNARILTVHVEESGQAGQITNGYYANPYQWYSYLYSTHDTIINGVYTDGDGDTYTVNNGSISAGWNWIITSTSNGSNFTYSGGTISSPMWTYSD